MIRKILFAVAFLFCLPLSAQAATCTWNTGASGTWNAANTAAWSCGHVPTSADTAVFDASSCTPGPCTFTVSDPQGTGTNTLAGLTIGACTNTCIIDNAATPVNFVVTSLSVTGTGTRQLKWGAATWKTPTSGAATWDFTTTTGLTNTTTGSTIEVQANSSVFTFIPGSSTFGALVIDANTNPAVTLLNGSGTFASLSVTAPANIQLFSTGTITFTGGFAISGSASSQVLFNGTSNSSVAATLAVGAASTCSWCVFRNITGATSSITATSSLNLGNNTLGTLSISAPTTSTGGGSGFIGGG